MGETSKKLFAPIVFRGVFQALLSSTITSASHWLRPWLTCCSASWHSSTQQWTVKWWCHRPVSSIATWESQSKCKNETKKSVLRIDTTLRNIISQYWYVSIFSYTQNIGINSGPKIPYWSGPIQMLQMWLWQTVTLNNSSQVVQKRGFRARLQWLPPLSEAGAVWGCWTERHSTAEACFYHRGTGWWQLCRQVNKNALCPIPMIKICHWPVMKRPHLRCALH